MPFGLLVGVLSSSVVSRRRRGTTGADNVEAARDEPVDVVDDDRPLEPLLLVVPAPVSEDEVDAGLLVGGPRSNGQASEAKPSPVRP